MQTPSKYLDFLDANEHREYTKQIVANSTNQTQAPENIHPTNPDINTDWQDAYLRNAPMYNLTWEKSISKNVALEMAFLNNKISFTAEYFWKDNNDLLAPLLPLASSGQTIMTNGGGFASL